MIHFAACLLALWQPAGDRTTVLLGTNPAQRVRVDQAQLGRAADLTVDPVSGDLLACLRTEIGGKYRWRRWSKSGKLLWDAVLPDGYYPVSCLYAEGGELRQRVVRAEDYTSHVAAKRLGDGSADLVVRSAEQDPGDEALNPAATRTVHKAAREADWLPSGGGGPGRPDFDALRDSFEVNVPYVGNRIAWTPDFAHIFLGRRSAFPGALILARRSEDGAYIGKDLTTTILTTLGFRPRDLVSANITAIVLHGRQCSVGVEIVRVDELQPLFQGVLEFWLDDPNRLTVILQKGYLARVLQTFGQQPGVPARGAPPAQQHEALSIRALLVDPDGGWFTFSYDVVNRTTGIISPSGRRTTVQYDAAGRRTTLLQELGSQRQYRYDAASRLTTQIDLNAASAPVMTILDSYDNTGNRTRRDQDGVVTTWVYDDAYRLTGQVKTGARATFVYDPAGNIEVKWQEGTSPMSFMFDAANRITTQLQGANLTSFLFDANGNQQEENLAGARTTNVYDNENRLTGVLNADGSRSTYSYDGDGLRRSAQEPGAALTTFIWDGTDYLMEKS